MFLRIDLPANLLRLLPVTADDGEFVLALLAIPDGELFTGRHRDTDFAGVLGDFIVDRHGGNSLNGFTDAYAV